MIKVKRLQLLVLIALVSLMLTTAPKASATPEQPPVPNPAVPPATLSIQNTIHELYAKGEYRGESVEVDLSNSDGYILYHGVQIRFIGWYSQYWEA